MLKACYSSDIMKKSGKSPKVSAAKTKSKAKAAKSKAKRKSAKVQPKPQVIETPEQQPEVTLVNASKKKKAAQKSIAVARQARVMFRLASLAVFSIGAYLGTGYTIWLVGRTIFDASLRTQDLLQLLIGSFFLLWVVGTCLASILCAGIALLVNPSAYARNNRGLRITLLTNILVLVLLMLRVLFLFIA